MSENTWNRIKHIYTIHKHKITPVANFVKDCVYDVVDMKDNPGLFNYLNLGLLIADNYSDTFLTNTLYSHFQTKEWTPYFLKGLHKFLAGLLMTAYPKQVKLLRTEERAHAYLLEIDGLSFGWVNDQDTINAFYVKKACLDKVNEFISETFWTSFNSNKAVVGISPEGLEIEPSHQDLNFVKSGKCEEYAAYINAFKEADLSRSVLFYGKPGAGKTFCVKGIVHILNVKCLTFISLSAMNPMFVSEIIDVLKPDCIVLEDIDHSDPDEIDDLLDKLEMFNQQKKLVLATANEISLLDSALIRPGRFDETIEISHLDELVIMKLVNNDKEVFEIVKSYPVAFICEVVKRIKVLGKDKALSSLQDLEQRLENIEDTNYTLKRSKINNFDLKD